MHATFKETRETSIKHCKAYKSINYYNYKQTIGNLHKKNPSFWPPKKFTVFAPHLSACQCGHAIEQ